MTEEQYRRRWLRQHNSYERTAYSIFSRSFRETALRIPFNFINENNYEQIINNAITTTEITNAYYEVYNEIGQIHGTRTGNSINRQLKDFIESIFLNQFQRTLLTWLLNNAGTRITTVSQTYADYIIQEIARGLAGEESIRDIVSNIQRRLNNPRSGWYRWQLLRIARTETTAAANHGATVATQISGVATDKVWISADDSRVRRPPKSIFNHAAMNGVKIDQNEKFNVNGDLIDFPGDPKGEAGNIINCRCASAVVVRRDNEGNIIRI